MLQTAKNPPNRPRPKIQLPPTLPNPFNLDKTHKTKPKPNPKEQLSPPHVRHLHLNILANMDWLIASS